MSGYLSKCPECGHTSDIKEFENFVTCDICKSDVPSDDTEDVGVDVGDNHQFVDVCFNCMAEGVSRSRIREEAEKKADTETVELA